MLSGQALALSWCNARPLPACSACQPSSFFHWILYRPCTDLQQLEALSQGLWLPNIALPLLWIWPSSKWKAIPPLQHHYHHYHHHSKGAILCLYPQNHPTSCLLLKLLSSFAVMGKQLCHHILCSSWHYLRSVQGQSSNLCLIGVHKYIFFFFLSTKSGFF